MEGVQQESSELAIQLVQKQDEVLTLKQERESLLATLQLLQEELNQSERLRNYCKNTPMMTSIRVLPPGSGKIVERILVKCFNEIALIEWTKKNECAEEQFSTAIFIEISYFERVRLVKYHNTRITFIDKCLRGVKNFPATFLLGLLVRHLHSISIEK